MSKKFKSIENDEEFKNFKLEDYLPSMPNVERTEKSADAKSEVSDETGSLFPDFVIASPKKYKSFIFSRQ